MDDVVISVSSVSKRYELAHLARSDTLRDTIAHGARGLFQRMLGRSKKAATEEFWALRDISFEVRRGEVLGIIGRNGAGKSTLLKVLSRITEPTYGSVRLRGRVASLLEVGTGFHPELSGRENIYLNGAILGMRRWEIRQKFDEIVAFAEVERFLDTPVKHYSSGMYVRLAFAVAAHLEPEILIVDEVLAVGDAQFQKKCLGKMGEVARDSGRTVLFVSHNTGALQAICQTGIWLQQGKIVQTGPIADCLSSYLQSGNRRIEFNGGGNKPRITSVEIDHKALAEGVLSIAVGFSSLSPLAPVVGVVLYDKFGQPITGSNGRMAGQKWRPPAVTGGVVTARLAQLPLHSDTYRVSVWLGDASMDYDEKRDIVEFDYISRAFHPQAPPIDIMGPVDLPWEWSLSTR